MNNKIVPPKKVVKYKHLIFGLVILISGIFFGFSAGIYMIRNHVDFFRPPPQRMTDRITDHIIKDYPYLSKDKMKLNKLIGDKLKEFHNLNEEISYRILQLQHEIAVDVSDCMMTPKDKTHWMQTFPEYFPGHRRRLPKAKRFEERSKNDPDSCMLKDWQCYDDRDNQKPRRPKHDDNQ